MNYKMSMIIFIGLCCITAILFIALLIYSHPDDVPKKMLSKYAVYVFGKSKLSLETSTLLTWYDFLSKYDYKSKDDIDIFNDIIHDKYIEEFQSYYEYNALPTKVEVYQVRRDNDNKNIFYIHVKVDEDISFIGGLNSSFNYFVIRFNKKDKNDLSIFVRNNIKFDKVANGDEIRYIMPTMDELIYNGQRDIFLNGGIWDRTILDIVRIIQVDWDKCIKLPNEKDMDILRITMGDDEILESLVNEMIFNDDATETMNYLISRQFKKDLQLYAYSMDSCSFKQIYSNFPMIFNNDIIDDILNKKSFSLIRGITRNSKKNEYLYEGPLMLYTVLPTDFLANIHNLNIQNEK